MTNLQTFANLLKDYIQSRKQLPTIKADPNTHLGLIVGSLSERTFSAEAEEPETAINSVIKDFSQAVNDEFFMERTNNYFDNIANAFGERIKTSFNDLRQVRDMVDDLAQRFDDDVARGVTADPFLSKHMNKQDDDAHIFDEVSWEIVNHIDLPENIVPEVNEIIPRFKEIDGTSPTVLERVAIMLNEQIDPVYTEVDMTESTVQRLADEMTESLEGPGDVYLNIINVLNKRRAWQTTMQRMINIAEKVTSPGERLQKAMAEINRWNGAVDFLRRAHISNTSRDKLERNLQFVEKVLKLIAYFIIHCRNRTFVNSVILPSGELNPDNRQKFFDGGGTKTRLAQYIKHFYNDGEMLKKSPNGITVQAALSSMDKIDRFVEEETRNVRIQMQDRLNRLHQSSFTRIVRNYVFNESELERMADNRTVEDLLRINREKLVNASSVEDLLYDIFLKVYYRDEFVTVLYRRLGTELTKMLANKSEIEENEIGLVETKVLTSMISEFVLNSDMISVMSCDPAA